MKRFDLKTGSRRVLTSTAITVLFQGIGFFSYDPRSRYDTERAIKIYIQGLVASDNDEQGHEMIDLQGLDDDEDRDRCASVIIERGADTTINNSGDGQSMSAR